MFCERCGQPVNEGNRFCEYCGASVNVESPMNLDPPMNPEPVAAPIRPVDYQNQVPTPEQMPNAGQIPTPEQMPDAGQIPTPEQMPNAGQIPTPWQMPNAGQVPTPEQMPNQGMNRSVPPMSPASDINGQKKKSKAPIIIGICVGVVLLFAVIFAGAYVVINKLQNTSKETTIIRKHDDENKNKQTPETEVPTEVETESESESTKIVDASDVDDVLNNYVYQLDSVYLDGKSYTHTRDDSGMYHGEGLTDASGAFYTKLLDLDNDAINELLVLEIRQTGEGESAYSDIVAQVYEYDGVSVYKGAEDVIATNAFGANNDQDTVRVTIKDGHYLCVDHTYNGFLETDGSAIDMQLWEYDGTSLNRQGQITFDGSDWTDATSSCEDIRTQLESAGLSRTVEQVYSYGIFAFSMADTGMEPACKIYAEVDHDAEDIFANEIEQVNTVLHYSETNGAADFYYPESNISEIDDATLDVLSSDELNQAQCEILARYGIAFIDKDVQAYFDSKAWYIRPYCDMSNVNEDILTEVEKTNVKKIQAKM